MTQTQLKNYDSVGAIIDYECGELSEEGTIELFQHLVDTGLAWTLQGSYGRSAVGLAQHGYITLPADKAHLLER